MLTEINNKKLYIKDKTMVHDFAQITGSPRMAGSVDPDMLDRTVGPTIPNNFANLTEMGVSANQAGSPSNSSDRSL